MNLQTIKKRKTRCRKASIFIPCVFILLLAFQGHLTGNSPESNEDEKIYEVFVAQQFWHTGIVFNTRDVDSVLWPEINNYRHRNFVDIGWGDEKFYQAYGNPILLGARAMLWPTQSVLQVIAFSTRLRAAYGKESRILRIPVNGEQLAALSLYVADSYIRDESGDPMSSTVYGETDHYFLATKKYHVFRTCNTWVARGFRNAGFNVRSFGVLNANQLYRQLSGIPGAEFLE
jgi:uncharacterized protein (TIGR02117 family)